MRRAACGGGHTAPRYLATSHIQQGVAKTAAAENTPDPGPWCCCRQYLVLVLVLVAAGGCWSPVWPRRTAECGAGTADSGQRTPRPRSTGGPGTRRTRHVCRDHSQAGDTWHVAPRYLDTWPHVSASHRRVCCQPPLVWARGRLRWLVAGLAGAAPPPATARLATFK